MTGKLSGLDQDFSRLDTFGLLTVDKALAPALFDTEEDRKRLTFSEERYNRFNALDEFKRFEAAMQLLLKHDADSKIPYMMKAIRAELKDFFGEDLPKQPPNEGSYPDW